MSPSKIIELDIDKVMKQGLLWNIVLLLLFAVTYHLFTEPLSFGFSLTGIILFIIGYLLLVGLHEFFHLLGFILFGRVALSSLSYGVNMELGVAYATTDRPLKNKAMRKALLLPFWMTGILPGLIGFITSSQILVLLSAMLIAGAVGDFVMYQGLRSVSDDAFIVDDQTKPRLYVYEQGSLPDHNSAD